MSSTRHQDGVRTVFRRYPPDSTSTYGSDEVEAFREAGDGPEERVRPS